ncbi:unknown protein [Desulfotalea psychrophila LSv54]|uniref:Uncharacterized protein n=2 Tax=Desulfotalea psychrophila TaxID=84980 RepID=Q6APD6_DESPS|nr:unknown protein [Desulfotalea psychrophila LSv54]
MVAAMGGVMQAITLKIVQELIESFYELNAGRALLRDFLPILDHEGFFMELAGTDIRFLGIAGLADHQMGKLIFFDQKFILLDIEVKLDGDTALAQTNAEWHASTWSSPDPYSHRIKVALLHTWHVGRAKDDSRPILLGHVCEEFHYLPGFAPKEQAKEFHLTQES